MQHRSRQQAAGIQMLWTMGRQNSSTKAKMYLAARIMTATDCQSGRIFMRA
jgi:hypothetical protein